tara:strand:- start:16208 stop:17263 length:1056 start_codon:yes stop_codon:yes gene_type:complete
MKKITLGLIISTIFNFQIKAQDFNTEFYKILLQNNYEIFNSQTFNSFLNIEETEVNNKKFVENCIKEENIFEKTTCYKITGESGIHDGYLAYADFYFDRYLKSNDKNEKIKSIIFASKFYGIAEGIKKIPLRNQSNNFQSKIQSFGDFLENPKLKVNDLNPLVDFHMSGIIDSLTLPINSYLKIENKNFFDKSFFDIDQENVSTMSVNEYIDNLINSIENKNAITFLKINNSKNNISQILDSLYYGKNNIKKDKNNALNYLYDLGFKDNNINAMAKLQMIFYRELKLNKNLKKETEEKYINNILKISAKIYNLDNDNENVIVTNIIEDFAKEKSKIIEYVQSYNKYRKYSK